MASMAELLMEARAKAGMTQRELSGVARIPQASVSLIERGLIAPRSTTVDRWLAACGASLRLETAQGSATVRRAPPCQVRRSLGRRARYVYHSRPCRRRCQDATRRIRRRSHARSSARYSVDGIRSLNAIDRR